MTASIRLAAAMALLIAAAPVWAARGRPVMVTVPEGESRTDFVRSWNGGLGMEFDLVMNAADAADPFDAFEGIAAGEAAWRITNMDGVAALAGSAPKSVTWLFLDFYAADGSRDLAAEVDEAAAIAAHCQWKIALLPPPGEAAALGPRIADRINAFIVPLAGPTEGLLDSFRPIADSVVKANGRCRIGVYLPESDLSTPDGVAAWLPFYDESDDYVHFYAGRFPEDGAALTAALTTLNADLEGPKASEGMHADRFRAPDVPLDPQTERRMRLALSAMSLFVLLAVPALLFLVKRSKGA